jgi:anti-sigma B factor antagonist
MSKLKITKRQNTNVTILDLWGKVQIGESSIKLRTSLRGLIQEGEKNILLNLAKVSQIDSSGLGELVAGFVSLEKNGGKLKLLNLTDRVSELMMITKLLTVFEVYENEEEAVNSFQIVSENGGLEKSAYATGKLDKAVLN